MQQQHIAQACIILGLSCRPVMRSMLEKPQGSAIAADFIAERTWLNNTANLAS
jgi:hypothetical protein